MQSNTISPLCEPQVDPNAAESFQVQLQKKDAIIEEQQKTIEQLKEEIEEYKKQVFFQ